MIFLHNLYNPHQVHNFKDTMKHMIPAKPDDYSNIFSNLPSLYSSSNFLGKSYKFIRKVEGHHMGIQKDIDLYIKIDYFYYK